MIAITTTHQEIGLAIGLWAVLVIALAIAALWEPSVLQSTDEEGSSTGPEPGVGFFAPNSHGWELKTPLLRALAPRQRNALLLTHIDDMGNATILTAHTPRHVDSAIQRDLECGKLISMAGTVQRIDYRAEELRVIVRGLVWSFTLAPDCQLWFEDKPAVLRCFHPLDNVLIIFAATGPPQVIRAMYAWEKQLKPR
jgi:hypothetical protein